MLFHNFDYLRARLYDSSQIETYEKQGLNRCDLSSL